MKAKNIIAILAIVGLLVFVAVSVLGGSRGKVVSAPVLFFSDLTDGPVSGWEGSSTKGAAVSVWGLNFGTSRGSGYVTCGGVNLTNSSDYAEWGVINEPGPGEDPADVYSSARGLQRITFWLNSGMTIGPGTISVKTSEGISNAIPFYCRALGDNRIYFIARDGKDDYDGLAATYQGGYNGPWFLAKKVRDLEAGDIAYFRAGIWNEEDGGDAVIEFHGNHESGIKNKSITMTSYPGEIAQLGDSSISYGIKRWGIGRPDTLNYWTISKFMMRAAIEVYRGGEGSTGGGPSNYFRLVGNDVSTYEGGHHGWGFCGQGGMNYLRIYGNNIHDMAVSNRGDVITQHENWRPYPIYVLGYGTLNHIDMGWNEFAYNEKGRLQFYGHTTSDWVDNVYIHDNYIHHHGLHGVILGGGDGGSAYEFMKNCYFYNNIIAFNGQRYPGTGGDAILMGGEGSGGNGGNWYVYNNVFYNNLGGEIYVSPRSNPTSIMIRNNIVVAVSGRSYYSGKSGGFFSGSNNCYLGGSGGVPDWDSNSMETDPRFLNPNSLDFHLQPTSPCIDTASWDVSSIVTQDYEGISRPQGPAYDIGAYEYKQKGGIHNDRDLKLPTRYSLFQNYPNPFNPTTLIRYALPRNSYVKLWVYNILGQKVATLVEGDQKAGYKTARWGASSFSSGIYFYHLQAGDFVQTRKMVLLR